MIISFESCLFSYMSRKSRKQNVNKPFPFGVLIFCVGLLLPIYTKFLKAISEK